MWSREVGVNEEKNSNGGYCSRCIHCSNTCCMAGCEKRNRPPQVISDLVSGKYENIETRVYVFENGSMIPYVVLDTDNYGDAVLLMRDFAYPQEMMYRDENMYGSGGAYYSGSIVDDFLEKTF